MERAALTDGPSKRCVILAPGAATEPPAVDNWSMPIYEYRCNGCGRRVQLLFRSFSAVEQAACPQCHSTDLQRLPSRISAVHSESSAEDFLSNPSTFENIDYNNPRAVAEWTKKMGEAAGVDMGSDYEEIMEQMERGEEPDDFSYGSGEESDFAGSIS